MGTYGESETQPAPLVFSFTLQSWNVLGAPLMPAHRGAPKIFID